MNCKVVILNNEILPYRIPLFAALSRLEGLDLHILYSTRRAWDRAWDLSGQALLFPHTVLPAVTFRLPKARYHEWRTLYLNPTLLWHLCRLSPEVIVAYEYSLPALTAMVYSRLSRCAYVVWSECTAQSDRSLTRGQRLTRQIIIPRARAYLGTSRAACANLERLGARPERVYEAPQSHDVQHLRAEAERARALRPPRPPTVLYVGAINERKGVTLLLRAFSEVVREMPQARLVLAGSGSLMPRLKAEVSRSGFRDRVEFLDFVEPASIPRVFADADVFVLPSLEDTFGVVVVEALATGVAVVCSKFAGVADYIADGRSGFVVDPTRTGDMAAKLLTLLRDPALRRSFADRGQSLASHFDAPAVAERFREAICASRPGQ
jgi:glycosyltransferase involved in cell wall biosynthesis